MKKQELIEKSIIDLIEQQAFHEGERIFSIREMATMHKTSVTPVLAAYQHLESLGIIQSRPKSGFYVTRRAAEKKNYDLFHRMELFDADTDLESALFTKVSEMAFDANERYPFAFSQIAPHLTDTQRLTDCLIKGLREYESIAEKHCYRQDTAILQTAISKWMQTFKCRIAPADIRITVGATQAILLALQACCRKDAAVGIECPGSPYLFLAAKLFGARIVPIPSRPELGLDLDYFEYALSEAPDLRCLICSPNFSTPNGSLLPLSSKQRLLELCRRRGIALIEDDINGDFGYDILHPLPLKSIDAEHVIYVSTFRTSLLNLSYITGGKYQDRIRAFGETSRACVPAVIQTGFAHYLNSTACQQELAVMQSACKAAAAAARQAVVASFPLGTKVTEPRGGFSLWIELPGGCSALALLERVQPLGVSFTLGATYSVGNLFQNCLRLNCSTLAGRPEMLEGIRILGDAVCRMQSERA